MSNHWIKSPCDTGSAAVTFKKEICVDKDISVATLAVSAMGLYEATIDGKKIGNRVFTPGFTSYKNRIQYQEYEITSSLKDGSSIEITVADGVTADIILPDGHSEAVCGGRYNIKMQAL